MGVFFVGRLMSKALGRLRNALGTQRLQAFIIPSSDAHMSEYICDADKQRDFISGFTGSNGTHPYLPLSLDISNYNKNTQAPQL